MPMYSYTSKDGTETTQKFFHMGKAPKALMVEKDGRFESFHRDVAAEWSGRRDVTTATWPQVSLSNAVAPGDVKRAIEIDARLGVPIGYNKRGLAVFDSRAQKQRWLKAHRRVDHDAGYGDPAPGSFGRND